MPKLKTRVAKSKGATHDEQDLPKIRQNNTDASKKDASQPAHMSVERAVATVSRMPATAKGEFLSRFPNSFASKVAQVQRAARKSAADSSGGDNGTQNPDEQQYPDSSLTPGATLDGANGGETGDINDDVCVSGHGKTVRNVTTAVKRQVYKRHGVPYVSGKFEVDHFIPLELGGANDIENLWPQPYTPDNGGPGAKAKDKVENDLHAQVCAGDMTLDQAQTEITTNWTSYV